MQPRCAPAGPCVLLLGWCVVLTLAAGASADAPGDFKIVLLPDTQDYTMMPRQNNPYFAQMQWIKDHAAEGNIRFVAHLGDIVNNRHEDENQWRIADQAHAILESATNPVPNSVLPGNHDVYAYGEPTYARDSSMYNEYFGVWRFEGRPWYGGHYGSTNDNNYSFFSVGGLDFLVMAIEVMPSDGALAWADQVIKHYPNRRVILTTHKYLKPDGTRYTDTIYHGLTGNSGQQIFDKLVKGNPNVFLVASGHVCYEGFNTAANAAGGQVHELLTDYQSLANGGNGWLRVLEFSPRFGEITVRSYSPILNRWDLYGAFGVRYDMGGTPEQAPEAVLRGYWPLDDGLANPAATTTIDASGLSGLATLTNFASPPSWGAGHLGGALRFDGLDDRVMADMTDSPRETDAISLSLWVKKLGRSRGDYGELVGRSRFEDPANTAFSLAVDGVSSKLSFSIQPADLTRQTVTLGGGRSLTENEWHHVAAVFQPGWRMAIYLDGQLDVELTAGVPHDINNPLDTLLTLGNLDGASGVDTYCLNGLLDEVRLFSGVLTGPQIAALAAEQEHLLPGDANRDRKVDDLDASILAANWQAASADWARADFNGDGRVDDLDASILASHWQATAPAVVPEPTGAALLCALAMLPLLVRRRADYSAAK